MSVLNHHTACTLFFCSNLLCCCWMLKSQWPVALSCCLLWALLGASAVNGCKLLHCASDGCCVRCSHCLGTQSLAVGRTSLSLSAALPYEYWGYTVLLQMFLLPLFSLSSSYFDSCHPSSPEIWAFLGGGLVVEHFTLRVLSIIRNCPLFSWPGLST
jgi:hypothetical protein